MTAQTKGVLVAIAGALLLISILGQSWWAESKGKGSVRMGLTKIVASRGFESESVSLSDVTGDKEGTWVTFGTLSWWAGLLTVLGCAGAAVVAFRNVSIDFPLWQTLTVLSGIALLCGFLFFTVLRPDGMEEGLSNMSYGFPLYLIATIGVLVIGIREWGAGKAPVRTTRPVEDDAP